MFVVLAASLLIIINGNNILKKFFAEVAEKLMFNKFTLEDGVRTGIFFVLVISLYIFGVYVGTQVSSLLLGILSSIVGVLLATLAYLTLAI